MGDLEGSPPHVEQPREHGVVNVLMGFVFAVEGVVDGQVTYDDQDEPTDVPRSPLACMR